MRPINNVHRQKIAIEEKQQILYDYHRLGNNLFIVLSLEIAIHVYTSSKHGSCFFFFVVLVYLIIVCIISLNLGDNESTFNLALIPFTEETLSPSN